MHTFLNGGGLNPQTPPPLATPLHLVERRLWWLSDVGGQLFKLLPPPLQQLLLLLKQLDKLSRLSSLSEWQLLGANSSAAPLTRLWSTAAVNRMSLINTVIVISVIGIGIFNTAGKFTHRWTVFIAPCMRQRTGWAKKSEHQMLYT